MNRAEIAKLLTEVRALDNRHITEELIDGWQSVLYDIPLPVALEAHRLARRDPSINYMEPRHIISWSREARHNLQPKTDTELEPTVSSQQPPKCKEHGISIMECHPCQKRLAGFAERFGIDKVPGFARAEIF